MGNEQENVNKKALAKGKEFYIISAKQYVFYLLCLAALFMAQSFIYHQKILDLRQELQQYYIEAAENKTELMELHLRSQEQFQGVLLKLEDYLEGS